MRRDRKNGKHPERNDRRHSAIRSSRVKVTAVREDPPDLDRFVAALLALAMDRIEIEQGKKNTFESDLD